MLHQIHVGHFFFRPPIPRKSASLPSKHYYHSWRRTNLETQHQRANISFDKKTTVKRNQMGDRNLTTKTCNKQS